MSSTISAATRYAATLGARTGRDGINRRVAGPWSRSVGWVAPAAGPRVRPGCRQRLVAPVVLEPTVSSHRELVHGRRVVCLPRTQERRGEVRLVRRIREVLGLQR